MEMNFGELCSPWPEVKIVSGKSTMVSSVVEDSRQAGPGKVFVAAVGHGADGHDYIQAAVEAGVSAVIVDEQRSAELRAALLDTQPVAWATAPCTRGLSARLARECEGRPDSRLIMAGITGTNGKTTTAFLLQELLGRLQGPCGLLGTIRYDDGKEQIPAPLTTPGGPMLYSWLGRMVNQGCRAAAMEVSSHALDQERPGELALDVAVMTNLGRDHLDYHGDMATYLAAKARILKLLEDRPRRGKPVGTAIINAGEPELASVPIGDLDVVRFAVAEVSPETPVDLKLVSADLSLTGTELTLDWRGQQLQLSSPLVGRFNVENLVASLAVGLGLGFNADDCVSALAGIRQVPGRMERFILPSGGLAVVDYAHTHDALAAVLKACQELSDQSINVVFGCGGDRDRGKRPLMGAVAAEHADLAWITSDNPRSEDPDSICREIVAGFDAVSQARAHLREVVVDRTQAIEAALARTLQGDVVVIAGKGHEDYQLVGDQILHLDDREVIRHWIAREQNHG